MNATDLAALIGRQGLLRVSNPSTGKDLHIPVQVLDCKRSWGNLRYQVTPLHHGKPVPERMGKDWVDAGRVTLE